MYEYMKMIVFRTNNGEKYDTRNNMISAYYNCRVTTVHIEDTYADTRFYLPESYIFLEERLINEFNIFDRERILVPKPLRAYFSELYDNSIIFMYQCVPNKIMSYERMKRMFIDLILPQQFLSRQADKCI